MNENFDKVFHEFDSQNQNQIDIEDGISFIQELMRIKAPKEVDSKDQYEVKDDSF